MFSFTPEFAFFPLHLLHQPPETRSSQAPCWSHSTSGFLVHLQPKSRHSFGTGAVSLQQTMVRVLFCSFASSLWARQLISKCPNHTLPRRNGWLKLKLKLSYLVCSSWWREVVCLITAALSSRKQHQAASQKRQSVGKSWFTSPKRCFLESEGCGCHLACLREKKLCSGRGESGSSLQELRAPSPSERALSGRGGGSCAHGHQVTLLRRPVRRHEFVQIQCGAAESKQRVHSYLWDKTWKRSPKTELYAVTTVELLPNRCMWLLLVLL